MPVGTVGSAARIVAASSAASMSIGECGCLYVTSFQAVAVRPASSMAPCTSLYLSHPGSPAAYVSIRQHTSAYALHKLVLVAPRLPCSIRQHTSAYVSMRQHTPCTSLYLSHPGSPAAYQYLRQYLDFGTSKQVN